MPALAQSKLFPVMKPFSLYDSSRGLSISVTEKGVVCGPASAAAADAE